MACETQSTPSPPIWISPAVSRSIQLAMKWQPMPARAVEPSGTLVEVLCGQPAQKYGRRLTLSDSLLSSSGSVKSRTSARRSAKRCGKWRISQSAVSSIRREGRSSPRLLTSGWPPASRLPRMTGRTGAL